MSRGRQVLVAVYAVFAVAAGSRAVVQLATKGGEAPLAYTLSLVAALVYVLATLALRRTGLRAYQVALGALTLELVGVLGVGTLTVLDGDLFPDETVWSTYGSGYLFVPLVLPVVGLWWLRRHPPQPGAGRT